MNDPRVVQMAFGRFHHVDLARELHRRGSLCRFFSTYPMGKLRQEGVPEDRIGTFPWVQLVLLGKWRLGWTHERLDRDLAWQVAVTFDAHVARNLPVCDVLVAMSGSGLRTGGVARERGAAYVCDRGSTHIREGDELLREEFARWGVRYVAADARCVAKEEAEYAAADVVTVPSEVARRSFESRGVPAAKLRVIPYGVDLERFRRTEEAARDRFEVLFVGQVSLRKGIPYLLDAFRRLRHPRKRLRVAGAVQAEVKGVVRVSGTEGVEFLGVVSRERVAQLMSSSHVLVLPSVEDGFGLVVPQAMACGCPVICSDLAGAADMVEEGRNGFVVRGRDSTALWERLELLASSRGLVERLGGGAMESVRALGGWAEYGSRFHRLCCDLGSRGAGPGGARGGLDQPEGRNM